MPKSSRSGYTLVRAWRSTPWLLLAGTLGATALAAAARLFWVGEVVCNLRLFLALAGVSACVALLVQRARRAAVVALGLGLLHAWPIAQLHFATPLDAGPSANLAFSVGSANLQYSRSDPEAFLRFARQSGPDVLALNEVTDFWRAQAETLRDVYPHQASHEPRGQQTFVLMLISKLPFTSSEAAVRQAPRPFLDVEVSVHGTPVQVIVIHPHQPQSRRTVELRNLTLDRVGSQTDWSERAVVLGDMNATLFSPAYADLLVRGDLRDTRAGFGYLPTFEPPLLPGAWLDLDHILVRGPFTVVQRALGPSLGSDHRPVLAELRTTPSR